MTTSSEPRRCPACSAEIPVTAPQGLCPKCLLLGVASVAESSGLSDVLDPVDLKQTGEHRPASVRAQSKSPNAKRSDPRQTPPSVEELAAAFPQLEVLELVGRGGMGFVYKARQPKLDRLVALKILPGHLAEEPSFHERFEREARVLAKLQHPLIVSVYDFGEAATTVVRSLRRPDAESLRRGAAGQTLQLTEDKVGDDAGSLREPASGRRSDRTTVGEATPPESRSYFYLMLEFVDGVNLREAMRAGRFTPDQALAIVPQVCEALQYAHSKGVLHRDIKPENILLDTDGRVKIADFGIAKVFDPTIEASSSHLAPGGASESELAVTRLTATGAVLGTPLYMAPEQLISPNAVDHRADIFSLGVVFYEMLTGELPMGRFAPPSEKSLANQQIDQRIDEVVLRALAKERELRQQSAGEMKTEVETISASPRRSPSQPPVPATAATSRQTPASLSASGGTGGTSGPPLNCMNSGEQSPSPVALGTTSSIRLVRRRRMLHAVGAAVGALVVLVATQMQLERWSDRFPTASAPPVDEKQAVPAKSDPFGEHHGTDVSDSRTSGRVSDRNDSAAETEAKRLGLIRVVDQQAEVYTFQQPIGLKGDAGEVLVEPHFSALVRHSVPMKDLTFTFKHTADSRQSRSFVADYPCDYIACDWTSGTDKPRIMGYLLPPGAYDFRADAETSTLLMKTDSAQRARIAADTLTIIRAAALKSVATESDWQRGTQAAHVRFKLVPKSISKLRVPDECLVVLTEKSRSLFTRSGGNFTKHEFVTDLNIRELRESIRPPVIVIDREFYEDTPADATVPENLPR